MKTGQDIQIRKGDHKQLIFDVTLPNEMSSLEDVEKIYWYYDNSFTSGETFKADDPMLEKEKIDMIIETSILKIDITTTESQLIDVGRYQHELRIEDIEGNISTIARGVLQCFIVA